jgi:hypothetical protein
VRCRPTDDCDSSAGTGTASQESTGASSDGEAAETPAAAAGASKRRHVLPRPAVGPVGICTAAIRLRIDELWHAGIAGVAARCGGPGDSARPPTAKCQRLLSGRCVTAAMAACLTLESGMCVYCVHRACCCVFLSRSDIASHNSVTTHMQRTEDPSDKETAPAVKRRTTPAR